MRPTFINQLQAGRNLIGERFRAGLSMRNSLLLSIVMHLVAATAIATFWAGTHLVEHANDNDEIVFELETITSEHNTSDNLSGKPADEFGSTNPDASRASGKASTPVKGNMNREAAVMASLASLTELTESFGFITHTVVSDSLGGFSPSDGRIPGSEYDSFGRKKGEGIGAGDGTGVYIGGGGFCPVPRGY